MVLVHAYIEVTELPDGINFYCGGLGLTLKRRLSPTWVELAGANLPIYLLANRQPLQTLAPSRSFEATSAIGRLFTSTSSWKIWTRWSRT